MRPSLMLLPAIFISACGGFPPGQESSGSSSSGGGGSSSSSSSSGSPDGGSTVDVCGTGALAPDGRLLPADVRAAAADLVATAGTDRLEVYVRSSSTMGGTSVADFQARACAALRFNVAEMQVDAADPALGPAVRVVILDDSAYAVATDAPGTYGVAFSADGNESDAIVLPESGLGNLQELDDTLAHELNHIVIDRLAPFNADFPWYFIEGLAISTGTRFGKQQHGVPTGFAKGWLDGADGSDATLTFQRYALEDLTTNLSEVGHDQSLSGFFVEFLRARVAHSAGPGFADAPVRILATFKANSNDGDVFDDAFANAFGGTTLSAAQQAYVTFMNDTAGDLTARYQGTVYAP